jgi:AraC family transcriptional regulator of adaptative response/methylated-DNA-[protein]-cysteine methyltransferase
MNQRLTNPERATSEAQSHLWQAVVDRDQSYDGQFVYSVASTGVYCRPSCASRQARRENVAFHATCADAETAGFRPCKRCRPNEASSDELSAAKITSACRLIEEADEPLPLAALAQASGMSPHHFHRTFRAVTGVTPKAYAMAHRRQRVGIMLKETDTVTAAIHQAGFNSSGRFYDDADNTLGMSPSDYRAGGAGKEIRYAFAKSSLGIVLVAMTPRGIAAITLADTREELLEDLARRFPKATLTAADGSFEETIAKVVALVEQPQSQFDLPLDMQGTAFQQRVWSALREIPAGTTLTYSELAEAIGNPSAVRAVASACANNPIAIAVPCHRVVQKSGALAGYRWGLARKRALIDREKKSN